jgi:hypothetical protein
VEHEIQDLVLSPTSLDSCSGDDPRAAGAEYGWTGQPLGWPPLRVAGGPPDRQSAALGA